MEKRVVLAVLGVFMLLACGGGNSQNQVSNQKIIWAWPFAPSAAWALETDDSSLLTQMGVAEPLTDIAYDGTLGPKLAASWKQPDALTWDFTLRSGVKFQNGTSLDAQAAVAALTHVLHATAPARALNPKILTSVEAVGSNVVRVHTATPNALVPFDLATSNAAILAPAAYTGTSINPMGTGTGPFIMTSQNLPQDVELKANPNYWGGTVHIAFAQMRYVPDAQTRASLIQSGEAQLVDTLPIASLPTLKQDSNVTVIQQPLNRTTALYINNQRAPFTDVRVRQAIQSAIDVNAIANQVLEGAHLPAAGFFPAGRPWSPPGEAPVPYDVAKAQSLLAQAGVDAKSLHLTLWAYSERAELPLSATAIQGMLSKIGINVTIRVALYAALEPDFLAGRFDMVLVSRGQLFDVADPGAVLLSDYTCSGSYNISRFCDSSVDAQVTQAIASPEAANRYKVYQQIAAMLQTKAVDVFLYNERETAARSPKLKNFELHPTEEYFLTAGMTWG